MTHFTVKVGEHGYLLADGREVDLPGPVVGLDVRRPLIMPDFAPVPAGDPTVLTARGTLLSVEIYVRLPMWAGSELTFMHGASLEDVYGEEPPPTTTWRPPYKPAPELVAEISDWVREQELQGFEAALGRGGGSNG